MGLNRKVAITNSGKAHKIGLDAPGPPVRLKRQMGLLEAVALTIGSIIGSGIFISPKGIFELVGSAGLSLCVWAACGLVTLSSALTYTELSTSMPSSGGTYYYFLEVLGPLPAFLYLWISVWIFAPAGNAILGLTFANYVSQAFFPVGCHLPESAKVLLAAASISFLTFLNCYDVRSTTRLQTVILFTKISPLVFIIGAGAVTVLAGDVDNVGNIISFQDSSPDPSGFAFACYYGLFTYGGWQVCSCLTEELKDPSRNMPLTMYISLPLVTGVYLLANMAYFSVLSPYEMLTSEATAVTFVMKLFGRFGWIMSFFVAISTFGVLSIQIMGSSRQLFVGARSGQFPEILGHIKTSQLTPTPSLLFLGFLSLCYLSTTDVFTLINYISYANNVVNLALLAAFFHLRRVKPDMERPIKVSLIHPIVFCIATVFLTVFPIVSHPVEAGVGVAVGLSGLPAYFFFFSGAHNDKRRWEWLESASGSFTRIVQKVLMCLPEDRT